MFWVPQASNVGMGVSILSYNGKVQFGLMTDSALTPEPRRIIERFGPQFEQLLYYTLMEACEIPREDEADESVEAEPEAKPRRPRAFARARAAAREAG
jgi:hypothetical protein